VRPGPGGAGRPDGFAGGPGPGVGGTCLWLEWEHRGVRARLPLIRPLVIGRHAGSDVCLPDPTVSRRHAVVSPVGGRVQVDAAGSTNGIGLELLRADKATLSPGQSFRIGGTEFRLVLARAPLQQLQMRQQPIPRTLSADRTVWPAQIGKQNSIPFAVLGAAFLVVLLTAGGALWYMRAGGTGPTGSSPTSNPADVVGVTPTVEQFAADWSSAPAVTDGVAVKYPPDWHVSQPTADQVVLRQPDSPDDRPVPNITLTFEPGVAVTQPTAIDGMSTPEAVVVAGLQGWEYHQTGLVAPFASTFMDLPYHGGRLEVAATRGPGVNLVPQLEEILKTLQVGQ
jgi:hypothetical protein